MEEGVAGRKATTHVCDTICLSNLLALAGVPLVARGRFILSFQMLQDV
jgi:hypothetical protein